MPIPFVRPPAADPAPAGADAAAAWESTDDDNAEELSDRYAGVNAGLKGVPGMVDRAE
jgi:hypothetical protein